MGLTKQQLEALNNNSFPNNNAGAITPAILRDYNDATIANTVNQDVYTTDSASFDSRIDGLATTSSLNAVSTSVGLLQTFSGSQYKADSASFSARILAVTGSGGNIDTSSFATTGSNTFIGEQTIVGNVTFPSSSFISTNNVSGNLYFSALNGGILHLNDDGGEGDVLVGYTGWNGKLKVRGNSEFTGSQTILSGSIAVFNNGNVASLNETEINVETYTSDAYGIIAANNHSASMGIISWDGATYDNELWIQADNSGIQLTDWDNGIGNISAVPFLNIGANDGSQPAPQFGRGLGITGSMYQSGTFYADGIDVSLGNIVETTGSYVATFSSGGVLTYDTYQNVATALQPYIQTGSAGNINTGSFLTTGSSSNPAQSLTGSLTISSSAAYDLTVQSRVLISGPASGQTPQLIISGAASSGLNTIGRRSITISGSGAAISVQGNGGSSDIAANSTTIASNNGTASFGIISFDAATLSYDNELWINTNAIGTEITDWDNNTSDYSTTPIMNVGPNNGGIQPIPQFQRGISVSGSASFTELTGSLASYSASVNSRLNSAGGQSQIQDEGIILGTATSFNFNGAGVSASISAGTASITIAGGSGGGGATLGANTFTGSQTISSSLSVVNYQNNGIESVKILPYVSSSTFNGNRDTIVVARLANTLGDTTYVPAATSPANLIFGTTNTLVSASSIVSGSNNIILNGRAAATNGAEIQANQSYISVFPSTRTPAYAPVLFTNSTINNTVTVINNTLGLSSSLALGSYAFGYATAARIANSLMVSTATLNPNSSSIILSSVVNAGNLTVTGNKTNPDFTINTGSGFNINNTLNLGTTTLVDLASGSNNFGITTYQRNLFGGIVTATNALSTTASANLQNSIIFGSNLIVTGSDGAAAGNGGSAFFGRNNDITNLYADSGKTIFAVGTGTGTGNRKTALSVDSSSVVNISGSLTITGSNLNIDGSGNVTASTFLAKSNGSTAFVYNQQSTGSVSGVWNTNYGKDGLSVYQYQGQPYAFNVILTANQINAYTGSEFQWGLQTNGTLSLPGGGSTYFAMSSGSTITGSGGGANKVGLDYLGTCMIMDFKADTSFNRSVYVDKGMYVSQSVGGGNPALIVNGASAGNNTAIAATGSVRITGSLSVNGQTTFASLGSNTFTNTQIVSSSIYIASNNNSNQLYLPSGSNKQTGTFVLDGSNPGTATISNSLVTANSLIFLTKQTNTNSGNGTVSVTSKGSGTFSVTSDHNGDTDTVAYMIINPS